MRMDWFQRITVTAFSGIILVTVWMLVEHEIDVRNSPSAAVDGSQNIKRHYGELMEENARIFSGVTKLQEEGGYEDAIKRLRTLMGSHPDNAYGYILLARLEYQQGSLTDALHAYREAVEKDPDYVDKTTPLFIGTEIMDVITASRGKINRERKLRPGDRKIRTAINDIYYLQRRIAGGCE